MKYYKIFGPSIIGAIVVIELLFHLPLLSNATFALGFAIGIVAGFLISIFGIMIGGDGK